MREKILQVLRKKGHGVTIARLVEDLKDAGVHYAHPAVLHPSNFRWMLADMEQDKLLILHRSSGSAGVHKGEIVLVCLRKDEDK